MRDSLLGNRQGQAFLTSPSIRLEEAEQGASINIRANLSDSKLSTRLVKAVGANAAPDANRFVELGDRTLIWQGPDELLVSGPYKARLELIAALEKAAGTSHVAVTDVTGNSVRWRLSGNRALEFLAAGCAIDMHPAAFVPGQCARTLFARTSATILHLSAGSAYELHFRRSLDGHLRRWAARTAETIG